MPKAPLAPGIGQPAADLASIISGIGDVLMIFAFAVERLGFERADLLDLLDILIGQVEAAGDPRRAAVAISMRERLLSPLNPPGVRRPQFRVFDGGRGR